MAEVLVGHPQCGSTRHGRVRTDRLPAPSAPADERSARRTLREQVARLETELSELFCSSWPRGPGQLRTEWSVGGRGGPRLLSLAELEELRDDLAARVSDARRALSDRTWVEEQNRRKIEEMLLEPEQHHWAHVSSEDIGEAGCRHWHVRPRFGILGMLRGWWRVVISSGCPLATVT